MIMSFLYNNYKKPKESKTDWKVIAGDIIDDTDLLYWWRPVGTVTHLSFCPGRGQHSPPPACSHLHSGFRSDDAQTVRIDFPVDDTHTDTDYNEETGEI